MEHTSIRPVVTETNSQPKQVWATPRLRTEAKVAEITLSPISAP
jgi:hypothetical protein